MENGESFAGACRAGHPTVRRCGDVRLRALVEGSWLGSSVSLWAKPHLGVELPLDAFFGSGQKRVFRRGTKGFAESWAGCAGRHDVWRAAGGMQANKSGIDDAFEVIEGRLHAEPHIRLRYWWW
jgi:hypothetical protein